MGIREFLGEIDGLPFAPGSLGMAKPDDPYGLLDENWIDTDPMEFMYVMRQWLGVADRRGHRIPEEYLECLRKVEAEQGTMVERGDFSDPSRSYINDLGFFAERAAAANADAARLTIEARRELIVLCLRGTRAITPAVEEDRSLLITEYREKAGVIRQTYDQALDNPIRTAQMPWLLRPSEPIYFALRELSDHFHTRLDGDLVVYLRKPGEPDALIHPRDDPAELAKIYEQLIAAAELGTTEMPIPDAGSPEATVTTDAAEAATAVATTAVPTNPGEGFAEFVSAAAGEEFAQHMTDLDNALQPEKDMPPWVVAELESRQEIADSARRRASQYLDFDIRGLDNQLAMQINGFHALIRAECEALALREEFYIEDVRRMWRAVRTYPYFRLFTPPYENDINGSITKEAGQ